MPINPSILGASDPDAPTSEELQREGAEQAEAGAAAQEAAEPPKRTRRSKAQMIADAVVPADDDQVDVKDLSTGAKVQRPWLVALEMIRDGKAEFADKAMKYSMLKYDQQRAEGAFKQPVVEQGDPISTAEQVSKSASVPPDAEVGDEVRVGADTFRVGHGGVLTNAPISVDGAIVQAKRRWQRELGAGVEGPWESVVLRRDEPTVPVEQAEEKLTVEQSQNGNGGEVSVETLRTGIEAEQVDVLKWKVGTGILQKIGLPDYSSLQIGPVSASRMVIDDGRRTTVQLGDRQASIPTAVVEAFQEVSDSVEYVSRYQRGELVSFLEATGALKQPVS